MRVSFPAKAVLSDLPLKPEKAKVTLQLVVNTGNIQLMVLASLEDIVYGRWCAWREITQNGCVES